MGGENFDFKATLSDVDGGLEVLHRSVDHLRRASGRGEDDRPLLLFETALSEIGCNVLTHGSQAGRARPVEYSLRLAGDRVIASLVDSGPPVDEQRARGMPGLDEEDGRGLAMARSLLDKLGYERDGDLNRWTLVKKL